MQYLRQVVITARNRELYLKSELSLLVIERHVHQALRETQCLIYK